MDGFWTATGGSEKRGERLLTNIYEIYVDCLKSFSRYAYHIRTANRRRKRLGQSILELRTNSTLVARYLGWDVGGSVGESRLKRLEQILKALSCHTLYASFLTFQFDNVLYIHWANSLRRKNKQAEGRWNVKKKKKAK